MTSHDIENYAAWSRINLGMPRSEFDRLLPREFLALTREWVKRERIIDGRIGRLQYTIAVAGGSTQPDGSPLTPDYFLPPDPTVKKKRTRRASGEQLFRQFCAVTGAKPNG